MMTRCWNMCMQSRVVWWVHNEMEMTWKGMIVAWLDVLRWQLPGRTEWNHEELQLRYPVARSCSSSSGYFSVTAQSTDCSAQHVLSIVLSSYFRGQGFKFRWNIISSLSDSVVYRSFSSSPITTSLIALVSLNNPQTRRDLYQAESRMTVV